MKEKKSYRACVLAVFQDEKGKLLICERSDFHSWQFPQGGVDEGESDREALYREIFEEIGVESFDIIKESSKTVRYDFPKKLEKPISKEFTGQEQRWFLCKMKQSISPDLSRATTKEFVSFRWEEVSRVLDEVIDWKKESYLQGLRLLGLL